MDMFEKATKAVKEVGENVIDSAKNLGTSIYSTSKEQDSQGVPALIINLLFRKLQQGIVFAVPN